MKKRTFLFDTSEGAGESLSKVLQHYALAAFPHGGSDCAAASREALLTIVNKIQADDFSEISTRQRPILNAAVKWFYTESEYANVDDKHFHLLSSQLQRNK